MAKRARPAQGNNDPNKMPPNVKLSTYGIGGNVHNKPANPSAASGSVAGRTITRGGPAGGKRPPRDPGVRVTSL